jgi:hypothetical protein
VPVIDSGFDSGIKNIGVQIVLPRDPDLEKFDEHITTTVCMIEHD